MHAYLILVVSLGGAAKTHLLEFYYKLVQRLQAPQDGQKLFRFGHDGKGASEDGIYYRQMGLGKVTGPWKHTERDLVKPDDEDSGQPGPSDHLEQRCVWIVRLQLLRPHPIPRSSLTS